MLHSPTPIDNHILSLKSQALEGLAWPVGVCCLRGIGVEDWLWISLL
jgi:hypothetical protein